MANPLASDIITLIRNLLREESGTDLPVATDAFLLIAISDGNLKWAQQFQQDGDAPIAFQREWGTSLVVDTTLSVACTTSSTTLSLTSSASFPSSGVIVIWDNNMPDIISYTGNAGNVLTGVTGIGFAHAANVTVQALYALPTTFGNFRQEPTYGDGVRLNGIPLFATGGPPLPGYFSMYDDGTTKYLWLPRQSTGSASVWYDKASSTIASTGDTVDVPDQYKFFLVWHALTFCYMGRGELVNLYQFAQMEENKVLQRALNRRNVSKKIKTRPFGATSRDFVQIGGQYISLP